MILGAYIRLIQSTLLQQLLYAAGIELEVSVGRQLEVFRFLYLNPLETIGITNDTVASQRPCRDTATIRLTVIGVLQKNADNLYTESLLQFLVADAFTQFGVNFNDPLSDTDVALHSTVLCNPMGAENREQRLFAEKPAFGNL